MASMNDIGEILDYPEWQKTAYENLANAIVQSVAEDYIETLIWDHGSIDNFNGRLLPKFRPGKATSYEKWFNSQWYHTLTGVPSEYMIDMCRKKAYDKRLEIIEKQEEIKRKWEEKLREQGVTDFSNVSCETCKFYDPETRCMGCSRISEFKRKWFPKDFKEVINE